MDDAPHPAIADAAATRSRVQATSGSSNTAPRDSSDSDEAAHALATSAQDGDAGRTTASAELLRGAPPVADDAADDESTEVVGNDTCRRHGTRASSVWRQSTSDERPMSARSNTM